MDIPNFFLQLVIILVAARVCGELVARFDVPSVIGELLAGILIGPSLFNIVEPDSTIKILADIGIVLLLFEVGIESDFSRLTQTGAKPLIVAFGGVIIPFVLGFFISYQLFNLSLIISLFIASTLTATSIGITIRVLNDLKRQSSDESQIVLGAAVIDDIIGIILLAMLYEFTSSEGIQLFNVGKIVLFIATFLILSPIAAKLISHTIKYYEKKSDIPGLVPTMTVSLILFFAWIAHEVGAPALLGGFAAGLALSKGFLAPLDSYLKGNRLFAHHVEDQMKPIIYLFAPIFFVTVGLSLNLREVDWTSQFIWTLSISLLIAAIIGKLLSGFLIFKEQRWVKWAVGLAMIPRGEVGLIFAEVGRTKEILNNDLYATLIIVIAITTIFTPIAMRYFYRIFPQSERNKDAQG